MNNAIEFPFPLNRAIELRNAFEFIIDAMDIGKTIEDILDLDNYTMGEFAEDNNTTINAIKFACNSFEGFINS